MHQLMLREIKFNDIINVFGSRSSFNYMYILKGIQMSNTTLWRSWLLVLH